MLKYSKECSPQCEYFRCGQYALRGSGRNVNCIWADDVCTGGKCNYAICMKQKLITNGVCAMTIRRKTREDYGPEAIGEQKIRIRGKILRRFSKDEIF